ncbi:MAG: DNA polymerase III subunit gamma/tau [Bacteroidales bacterium]|nr:DNA polymerase III subunit gamma/tau [Bacteroidales bacterium]
MENFIVSARKYRPQSFASVVGQGNVTSTLKNAILTNKLSQAFLFCGPRGVGKTTCARILAKTINCEHLTPEGEACDQCASCRDFNQGTSMSIFELDAASNTSVDDIRTLIEQVQIPPQSTKYKVYIIDEVHMLSAAAFNAFLKTLEEPPLYAKFILATTERHKIMPTILSRCQTFDFKSIEVNDIVEHLRDIAQKEGVQYEDDALHIIARKAEGGLRDALSTFDQLVSFTRGNLTRELCNLNLNQVDAETYFNAVDFFRQGNIHQSLLLYQDVISKGFDGQAFISGLSMHLRNLMVALDPATHPLLQVSDNYRPNYGQQAANCGLALLLKYLEIANDFEYRFKEALNKRLHVEVMLMKMASLVTNP